MYYIACVYASCNVVDVMCMRVISLPYFKIKELLLRGIEVVAAMTQAVIKPECYMSI